MQEFCETTGLIIKSEPYDEYDRRLVILTKDRGKISAFAKGARRQTNKLVGCSDVFIFGDFKLYAGRNAYSVQDCKVRNYFETMKQDLQKAMYGGYFLEVCDYLTHENADEYEVLNLLYSSLKALSNERLDNELIKTVFELKMLYLSGEFEVTSCNYREATLYTTEFIRKTPGHRLYSFTVTKEVYEELKRISSQGRKKIWQHEFKSEDLLKIIENE